MGTHELNLDMLGGADCLICKDRRITVQVKPGVLVSTKLPAGLDAATLEELSLRQRGGDDTAAEALTALRCRGVFVGASSKSVCGNDLRDPSRGSCHRTPDSLLLYTLKR